MPLYLPTDLGRPIPESPHAVSACLPTWADNIGYEEGESRVINTLTTGYPRFVYNRFCRDLFSCIGEQLAEAGEQCLVFPDQASALRARQFLSDHATQATTRVEAVSGRGVFALLFPAAEAQVAQAAWQHRGEGISSRQAEDLLEDAPADPVATATETLIDRIAGLTGVPADSVWLSACGMSAFAAIHRALCRLFPDRRSVQFGFPYVDALKVQDLCHPAIGSLFLAQGDDRDFQALESSLAAGDRYCGVFTEFPSNPLLTVPDLERLAGLCREFEMPLVVDETISGFGNVDVLPVADVICSSLTKSFSGVGDVTGGSLIINSSSPFAAELKSQLAAAPPVTLYDRDALVLETNSRDYSQRLPTVNENAQALTDWLREQTAVQRVYYPDGDHADLYDRFLRPGGGRGPLLSILLHHPDQTTPAFFDALSVSKGPNLGTNYTLACPFTILAHYNELEFAEQSGVSRYLVRVSVGLEPIEELLARFSAGLQAV